MLTHRLHRWLAITLLATLTAACGGGGGGGSSTPSAAQSSSPSPAPISSPTPTPNPTPSPSTSYVVHLSWTIPTTRADGSSLTVSEIAGYRIYYTRAGSNPAEDTVVSISGGTTTSADIPLTVSGTYSFAISAVDTSNVESSLSTPVSITVN